MRSTAIATAMFAIASGTNAQTNPYVVPGSIGRVEKPAPKAGLTTLEMGAWVGQKFIFLPKPTSTANLGYQAFEPSLRYSKWVGRIVTVTAITAGTFPVVKFRAADRSTLRATAYSENVGGIAPLRDLEYAREHWLGKWLWLRVPGTTTFDAASEKFGQVRLGRTARVKVANIVAGWYNEKPVRFILAADDGREGFIDVQLSGTNVSATLRDESPFSKYFDENDPHMLHKDWSARVWNAIVSEQVFIGMTSAQARASWGDPKVINRTTVRGENAEQWVYGDHDYLYVRNGVVAAVQN